MLHSIGGKFRILSDFRELRFCGLCFCYSYTSFLIQETVDEERFRRQIVIKSQRFNDDFFSEGMFKIITHDTYICLSK